MTSNQHSSKDRQGVNEEMGLPFGKMQTVKIAFDIDGTLRSNTVDQSIAPVANERIRSLLVALASFKNVYIVVWSGSGQLYARQVASEIGIHKYVNEYATKTDHEEIKPDIAIDDIQDTAIGKINLIVREK